MTTTDLRQLQPAAATVAPRPDAAAAPVLVAPICTGTAGCGKANEAVIGNGTTGSWLATSLLSMTVPAFHDRRPLCSTT